MKINILFFLFFLSIFNCTNDETSIISPSDIVIKQNTWILRNLWTLCSVPMHCDFTNMGKIYWFNDINKTLIFNIWPDIDLQPNDPKRVDVLTLVFTPIETSHIPQNSWGGIMRNLPEDFFVLTDKNFIEIWVNGNVGNVHIDLGKISEDVIPNKTLDTEDQEVNGVRNGLLDEGEDIGLDGVAGRDPFDFWDINKNGFQDPAEPTSYDDFAYEPNSGYYEKCNGTEGNKNDIDGQIPDTEDINGNGLLDQANNYFEYKFSLDKASPDTIYINSHNKGKGWYQYLIPLSEPDTLIGVPDIGNLEYMRIWFDGFASTSTVQIAKINIVGND